MSKTSVIQTAANAAGGVKFSVMAGAEYTLAAPDGAAFNAQSLTVKANGGPGGPYTYPTPNQIDSLANPLTLSAPGMVKFRALTEALEIADGGVTTVPLVLTRSIDGPNS